ncbi:hypothetical protein D9M70_629330 [compost metagenome]
MHIVNGHHKPFQYFTSYTAVSQEILRGDLAVKNQAVGESDDHIFKIMISETKQVNAPELTFNVPVQASSQMAVSKLFRNELRGKRLLVQQEGMRSAGINDQLQVFNGFSV